MRGDRRATSKARARSATTRLATRWRSGDGNTIAGGTAEESCLNGGINPSSCDIDTFPRILLPAPSALSTSGGAAARAGSSRRSSKRQTLISRIGLPSASPSTVTVVVVFVGRGWESSAAAGRERTRRMTIRRKIPAPRICTVAPAPRGASWPTSRHQTPTAYDEFGSSVAIGRRPDHSGRRANEG